MLAPIGLASIGSGCAPSVDDSPRNVILVSIDTLRPDHLGCYGYHRPTSPSIDAFCQQSWVFGNAVAHAPSTLLSHAAMLTSLIPQHHGASHIRNLPLSPEVPTLATVLRDAGWATASFNSGGQLAEEFGFGHGFDVYESGGSAFRWAVESALGWLDLRELVSVQGTTVEKRAEADRPFFLFLHSYEVHHPYTPDPKWLGLFDRGYEGELPDSISIRLLRQINRGQVEIDEADLDHIRATYDAEIRSMDEAFGALIRGLTERGLLDRTLVVLTSDHGEEFGEHGMVGWHSHTLYEELLKVPLVVRPPLAGSDGSRPSVLDTRIDSRVRSIDIAPTVLEILGLPPHPSFDGRSLVALALGDEEERSEDRVSIAYWDDRDGAIHQSITARHFKLHKQELYDLEADPGERVDLSAERPELAARMLTRLEDIVLSRQATESEAIELDEETEKQLRALGYTN